MGADLALLCLDVVTISCVLLIGAQIVVTYPHRALSWFGLLFCLAVAAHVAISRAEYGPWLPEAFRFAFGAAAPVLDLARNLAPGLFALLAWRMFTEHRRMPEWLVGLIVLQIAAEAAPNLFGQDVAYDAMSAALHVVFLFLALVWTLAYWRADLVEARRRTRALVAAVLVVDGVATSVLLRLVIPPDSYANYLTHVALTALTGAIAIFVLVRAVGTEAVPGPNDPSAGRSPVAEVREREDGLALERLERLLTEDCIYLEPGLSIAGLASRVGTPEYRLRRLIHQRLGFRNFNSFPHSHRVRAAAAQLSDPTLRRTPILTIALSCGYGSVGAFNRGFRNVMGLNPSDYRVRELGSGEPAADLSRRITAP